MCAAIILDGTAIQPPSVVLQINRPSPDQGHRTTEPKIIFLSKAAIELQSKATEDEYVDYETFKRIKKGNGKAAICQNESVLYFTGMDYVWYPGTGRTVKRSGIE